MTRVKPRWNPTPHPSQSTKTDPVNTLPIFGPIRQTRYGDLSYQRQGDTWRVIDATTGRVIGPQYATLADLLADLDRLTDVRGFA